MQLNQPPHSFFSLLSIILTVPKEKRKEIHIIIQAIMEAATATKRILLTQPQQAIIYNSPVPPNM
jgi:hypothetical protein